jgi:hypothetical protein
VVVVVVVLLMAGLVKMKVDSNGKWREWKEEGIDLFLLAAMSGWGVNPLCVFIIECLGFTPLARILPPSIRRPSFHSFSLPFLQPNASAAAFQSHPYIPSPSMSQY